jgi:hypothetical protein
MAKRTTTVKKKRSKLERLKKKICAEIPHELANQPGMDQFIYEISNPPEDDIKLSGTLPTKYHHVRTPQLAFALTKNYGCNHTELAEALGVTVNTIDYWLRRHLNFRKAITKGKEHWDTLNIGKALRERCLGYNYQEIKTETIELDGELDGVSVKVPAKKKTVTVKHIPADVRAIKFWLTNRDKAQWKSEEKIQIESVEVKEEKRTLELSIKGASSELLEKAYELMKEMKVEDGKPSLFLPEPIEVA